MNPTALVTEKVWLRKRESGKIGSAARLSTSRKSGRSTTLSAIRVAELLNEGDAVRADVDCGHPVGKPADERVPSLELVVIGAVDLAHEAT
jgi:hypothetical protein